MNNSWLCAVLLSGSLLWAGGVKTWEMSQFAEFSKGKMKGVSLTREGVLEPGLALGAEGVLASGQPSLWSVARAADGTVYVGAGPTGKVFSWKRGAKQLEDLGAPAAGHVFALAVDAKGVLYAGLSPGGAVYRRVNGKWEAYAQTGEKFIWALLFGRDGALYAGTGDEGKLWRIVEGKAELWWASGQANLTSLALDASGALLAGSDPNGMLYRVTAKDTARALFDAPFAEIRAIVPGASGETYFLAMGGLAAKRAPAAAGAAPAGTTPQVTTTITVTDEANAQAGLPIDPKAATATTAQQQQAGAAAVSMMEIPGLDRSAIYRLAADGMVDQLYVTKEESIFDIALREGQLHFVSDQRGRVYRLEAARQPSLLLESGEEELSRLVSQGAEWLALASTAGKVLVMGAAKAREGEFESPVHEAAALARWGVLDADGTGNLTWEARTGNTVLPDGTWGPWEALEGGKIRGAAAKYAQWRFRFQGDFKLRKVLVHYLPRNQAPVVKSITAVLNASAAAYPSASLTTAASAVYSLTVTDTGEAGAGTSSGTGAIAPTRPLMKQLLISWTSEDADGDTLDYRLEYRAEEDTQWRLLQDDLKDLNYALDADTLADGRYLFRVIASDALSNSLGSEQEGELISVPVVLDQTAPELTVTVAGGRLEVKARDAMSAVRRLEVSVNGKPWRGLDAADGILDSREEAASVALERFGLSAGENVLTVRAYDAAMNVAVKRVRVVR
jgi:hypothetical protein